MKSPNDHSDIDALFSIDFQKAKISSKQEVFGQVILFFEFPTDQLRNQQSSLLL